MDSSGRPLLSTGKDRLGPESAVNTQMSSLPDEEYYVERYVKPVLGVPGEARRAYLYRSMSKLLCRYGTTSGVAAEIGCGVGFMTRHLANMRGCKRVIGMDITEPALLLAARHTQGCPNISLIRGDAETLPLKDGSCVMMAAFDVVEHLTEPERFISEAFRVLAPKGIMMISTPNPESLGYRTKGHHPEWKGKSYRDRKWQWFGFQDDTHVSIRSMANWRSVLIESGFSIVRDGSTFWDDAPYFRHIPMLLQKAVFGGVHRILTTVFGFARWRYGENYMAICRKPALHGSN
jgi:SAM-dependent methyltransferase